MTTEAGVYFCVACRENPGDACNDYCEMEQVRELSPLDFPNPACGCCGQAMRLARRLVAVEPPLVAA